MDQLKSFEKCQCVTPGFCPMFNRIMGLTPPDWKWCKKTSQEERISYYNLLSKAPPSENQDILKLLENYNGDKRWFYLNYLLLSKKYHFCSLANNYQIEKNKEIFSLIDRQSLDKKCAEIEILCLGHSDKQFDSIVDRPYIKKINLNDIDAGKYNDNKWAEARAFVSQDNLFSSDVEWIGFTTASWNIKYQSFCRIDNFHNWDTFKVMINSKPEDKVVLCADVFCPCMWFYSENNVLSVFFKERARDIGMRFIESIGLTFQKHVKAPVSNQLILHKQVYSEYYRYLIDNDVFAKTHDFIENVAKKYLCANNLNDSLYAHSRINGYFVEMITCFWFASQDFVYLPNAERKEDWYNQNAVASRIKEWDSKERFGLWQ